MAKSGLSFINEDTGEVIDNVVIKLDDDYYDPEDVGFKGTFNIKDNEARKQNIRIYRISEPTTDDVVKAEHPEFGELEVGFKRNDRFTKVYHLEDPRFTKDSYYKYWYKLCCCLDKNTNIICSRNPSLHRVTTCKEIEELCEGSVATINKFLKECKEKGLIARFEHKGKKYFVLNPNSVLNGSSPPVIFLNCLFAKNIDETLDVDNVDAGNPY